MSGIKSVIRKEILKRADYRCQYPACNLPNGLSGVRALDGTFWPLSEFENGNADRIEFEKSGDKLKKATVIKIIVVTVPVEFKPGFYAGQMALC